MLMQEFFAALYPDLTNVIAIRGIKTEPRQEIRTEFCPSISAACNIAENFERRGYNVYFQCPEIRKGARNTQQQNCIQYNFLYGDLDLHDKDSKGNIVYSYTKQELADRIRAFPLQPSIVVDSGAGYHCYWLLDEPLADIDVVKNLLKHICVALGTDPNATLATQLLRVPGTHNHKHTPNPLVQVVHSKPNRYSLDEIMTALKIMPGDLVNIPVAEPPKTATLYSAPSAENRVNFSFLHKPKPLNLQVDSFPELIGILRQQNPLSISDQPDFPIGKTFCCSFHKDSSPSANVYVNDQGYYYYKCFGCGVHLNIIDICQRVTGRKFAEAVYYLAQLFGIQFSYSDWVFGQWEKYYHNAYFMDKHHVYELETAYPATFKLLKRRAHYYAMVNSIGHANIVSPAYAFNGESVFSFSYRYFARKFGCTLDTAVRNINLLAILGLINKVSQEDLPAGFANRTYVRQTVANEQAELGEYYPINFYCVPSIMDVLPEAERRARILLEHNFSVRNCVNKTFLLSTLGAEIANEVYPDDREITPVTKAIVGYLERTMLRLIEKQGYTTKKQIVSATRPPGRMKCNRERKERELDRFLTKLLTQNGLTKIRATKSHIECFSLPGHLDIIIPQSQI